MAELLQFIGRTFIDTWLDLAQGRHAPAEARDRFVERIRPLIQPPVRARDLAGQPAALAKRLAADLQRGLTPELHAALERYLREAIPALRGGEPSAGREEVCAALPDPLGYFPPVQWARIS